MGGAFQGRGPPTKLCLPLTKILCAPLIEFNGSKCITNVKSIVPLPESNTNFNNCNKNNISLLQPLFPRLRSRAHLGRLRLRLRHRTKSSGPGDNRFFWIILYFWALEPTHIFTAPAPGKMFRLHIPGCFTI